MIRFRALAIVTAVLSSTACRSVQSVGHPPAPRAAVVLTSDFGTRDGAVSAMKGVAFAVDPFVPVSDLTHEIPPFDLWQAAARVQQTYRAWPPGTVFVTVVDPGAGSSRRSVVVRTKSGHYFVGPDNGYLTFVADEAGVDGVRVIDETKSRRPGSETSNTFHGHDVFAFVGAQLASGILTFEQSGAASATPLVRLAHRPAEAKSGMLHGTITTLDPAFGNVWTNVPRAMLMATYPNQKELRVYIAHKNRRVFDGKIPFATTFASVPRGQPLIYVNGLSNLAVAANQDDFGRAHQIEGGPEWTIVFSKP